MYKYIVNFAIIAHIDHGKSTLADRFLELTKTITKEKLKSQFLDINPIERERGVTIKMQPVRMHYNDQYILNLIDTPGHIDFTYEVERALSCIEGAILLVDVTQGIQAQTIYNFEIAKRKGLVVIPVINKIDLIYNDEDRKNEAIKELKEITGIESQPILISAKTGLNVDKILTTVVTLIPKASINTQKPLKSLVFDSVFNEHKGVILFVRVFEGRIKPNDEIFFINNKLHLKVKEVGYFNPFLEKSDSLESGEIGYIATGIKKPGLFLIGETITAINSSSQIELNNLPQFSKPNSVLYVNIFPYKDEDFIDFMVKIDKYRLNDAAMVYEKMSDKNLGRGIKAGFLGQFHLEIFLERMKREEKIEVFITKPSVQFKVNYKDGSYKIINHANEIEYPENIVGFEEPYIKLHLFSHTKFFNQIYEYLTLIKAQFLDMKNIEEEKISIEANLPLRKAIEDFHDKIKSITEGYGSYYYEIIGFRKSDLSILKILIHGDIAEIFSMLIPKDEGIYYSRFLLRKLKDRLPREQFAVKLQAMIDGKILVRETLPALRKDIAGALYGGDRTRKMKLWQKQKKTKKELGSIGKVRIPPDLFIEILKKQ